MKMKGTLRRERERKDDASAREAGKGVLTDVVVSVDIVVLY
jgi:hypothetical protein